MFFTGYLSSTGSYSVSLPCMVWRCLLDLAPAYLRDLCYLTLGTRELPVPFDQRNGNILCPFCPYFNSPDSCILGGWPLCLEWASICTAIAPQGSLRHILL